jgi:hypothetical protein
MIAAVSTKGESIMSRLRMVGTMMVLAVTLACGPSEADRQIEEAKQQAAQAAADAEKAAEAASKAAEQAGSDMAKGVEGMARGAEGFAKAMEGMAGALASAAAAANGGKAVEPVSFRDLQALLPSISGWTMNKPRGERMTSPVAFSQTEARYTNGDQRIDVKIVDSGFHQMLLAPWTLFLARGYEKETESGYEKSVSLGDNPGFEKWNSDNDSGELNVVVGKRFLVSVEGRKVADTKVLHEFVSKVDTAKLASLK